MAVHYHQPLHHLIQLSQLSRTVPYSAMLRNDAEANNSRKRKMKGVAAEQQMLLYNVPVYGQSSSQVQRVLNTAASLRPFSFTPLPAPEPEDFFPNSLSPDTRNTTQQVDRLITLHNENLKNALYGTVDKLAEEKAAKKIRDKEVELLAKMSQNAKLEHEIDIYKGEIERLLCRVRSWERTASHLRKRLQNVNEACRNANDVAEEDAESSYAGGDRVDPVRLDCKVCERHVATMMMWPCRHVCVCTRCDDVTKVCPVCGLLKLTSIEVCIPSE